MFSNTTAELSLNTPSKCINSIPNDTTNHRFIVGTCALSTTSSAGTGANANSSAATTNNSLYLLRYHEEMNELAVDAQLDFTDDDYNENQNGEMWCMSSCPMDKTLLVACRNKGNGNGAETALWRIPEKAMKEDEIDYYPDDDLNASMNMNMNMNIDSNRSGNNAFDRNYSSEMNNEKLTKVDTFLTKDLEDGHANDDRNTNANTNGGSSSLKGRISDMKWNPECMPHADDGTGVGGGGTNGINFLTVDHTIHGAPTMTTWDISTSSVSSINRISIPTNDTVSIGINSFTVPNPPKASWDPHNTNLCAVTAGLNVGIVDMRIGNVVSTLEQCHKFGVTDLDHNPNKPNVLSTCGQDSLIKFWDLRYSSSTPVSSFEDNFVGASSPPSSFTMRQQPLRILRGGHTHWGTRVKYNSFHDQLLLSSGTDGMVNLWRVSSISSAPLLDLGSTGAGGDDGGDTGHGLGLTTTFSGYDDEEEEKLRLALIGSNEDDEYFSAGDVQNYSPTKNDTSFGGGNDDDDDDINGGNAPDVRVMNKEMRNAVYDLDWSAADPWIYVTLSFDGNVVLNHVPSKEKYKILL